MTETTTNYIYVLKLSEGRYYVGKSDNVIARFQQHLNSNPTGGQRGGSEWTKKYSPLLLIECYESKSIFDEDNKTKEYMMKYGFDNVRGGSYAKFDLSVEDLNALKKELAGSMGLCFNCGRAGHYIGECSLALSHARDAKGDTGRRTNSPVVGQVVGQVVKPATTMAAVPMELCKRCGRNNHTEATCGAKTTLDGKAICGRCGRTTHATDKCTMKTDYNRKPL